MVLLVCVGGCFSYVTKTKALHAELPAEESLSPERNRAPPAGGNQNQSASAKTDTESIGTTTRRFG